jgi:hypothetical protein
VLGTCRLTGRCGSPRRHLPLALNRPQAKFFVESYDLDAVVLIDVPEIAPLNAQGTQPAGA